MKEKTNPRKYHEQIARENLQQDSYLKKYGPRKIKVEDDLEVTFELLTELLVSHAYNVTDMGEGELLITGQKVRGYAVSDQVERKYDHPYAGAIWLDHADCYNKVSQCPVSIPLPTTAGMLFKSLRQIGSSAGLCLSRSFSFYPHNPFLCPAN